MDLESCLPPALRGGATLTKIAVGMSGAAVYRVDVADARYVLKVSEAHEPVEAWRATAEIQRRAAAAGVAPAVVHVDAERRAVLCAFVEDHSFPRFYRDPSTSAAAVALLGRTLRAVHDIDPPSGTRAADPRGLVTMLWTALAGYPMPAFVAQVVHGLLSTEPPPSDRRPALCHNDVNPTNLVHDGARVLLLDWDTSSVNDPYFDLATPSVFFRMDEPTCRALLAAHDGAPVDELHPRFAWSRRFVAGMSGIAALRALQRGGHPGGGDETLETAPTLADFYAALQAGTVHPGQQHGQRMFALAMLQTSATL